MSKINKLRLELQNPAYASLSDQAAFDVLNSAVVIKQPIPVDLVKRYLFLVNKYLEIKNATSSEAEQARDALAIFDEFDVTEPLVEAKLIAILDALVADTTLTFAAADKTAILAMGDKSVTKADSLSIYSLRLGEVIEARA